MHNRTSSNHARAKHLVEEYAAKVVAVGEHVRLARQVGAARVHQVDARQAARRRNLLQPQVLLRSFEGSVEQKNEQLKMGGFTSSCRVLVLACG